MKLRIVAATAALLGAVAATSATAETPTYEPSSERVQFAVQCVTAGSDPRCVSQNYALSLDPGASSVGNALGITPLGMALAPAEASFAADKTLAPEYRLIGGSTITGQVTLRQTGSASTPVAALSTVTVSLAANRVDTKKSVVLGDATIERQVVTSAKDAVYTFSFVVPAKLDGVAVKSLNATVTNKQVSAGYGYFDGQGGSFFDLPYYAVVEQPAA